MKNLKQYAESNSRAFHAGHSSIFFVSMVAILFCVIASTQPFPLESPSTKPVSSDSPSVTLNQTNLKADENNRDLFLEKESPTTIPFPKEPPSTEATARIKKPTSIAKINAERIETVRLTLGTIILLRVFGLMAFVIVVYLFLHYCCK